MNSKNIETIFKALNREKVRYLIAGGLAVVAHGHLRYYPATEIDLFIEPPIGFSKAYDMSIRSEVAEGVEATIIGLDDLIVIKKQAGREIDLDDIEKLRRLRQDNGHE